MGFEPWQNPSGLKTVNEFTERMRTAIDEAKSTIHKARDDMKRYYNRRRTLAVKTLNLTVEYAFQLEAYI